MAELAKPGQYALLGTAVDSRATRQIEDLNLPGIYTQPTTQRQYPGRTTAANVIGFMHSDGTGAAGIEAAYNEVLAGRDGTLTYAVDDRGRVNPNGPNLTRTAVDGGTVRLTLDQDLQYTVQGYLDAAVAQSQARGGQVAVLDAHTGQVLALASSATFNPADPATIGDQSTRDPAIQSVFEPGSVNKLVTFSAALEKGVIKPSTVFTVPDTIEMGGIAVHDAWSHPTAAIHGHRGAGRVVQRRHPEDRPADRAGGVVRLRAPVRHRQPDRDRAPGRECRDPAADVELVRRDLRQRADRPGRGDDDPAAGLDVSDDRQRRRPGAAQDRRVGDPGGRIDRGGRRQPAGSRVVSAKSARTVRTMLESTILPGGTGVKAAIPGYRVAGKTGTAQQPDPAQAVRTAIRCTGTRSRGSRPPTIRSSWSPS